MSRVMEVVASYMVFGFIALLGLFGVYTMLVWAPVNLYASAKRLAAGYLKAQVSVGLEIYCTTLDGAVTVRVDKL